jgi:hypothetical protein
VRQKTKEESMKKKVGLWIDQKSAVIISLADKGVQLKRIPLESENEIRWPGRPQKKLPGNLGDNRLSGHLGNYCDEVFSNIYDAESIMMFGFGEAKAVIKTRLENKKFLENIIGSE